MISVVGSTDPAALANNALPGATRTKTENDWRLSLAFAEVFGTGGGQSAPPSSSRDLLVHNISAQQDAMFRQVLGELGYTGSTSDPPPPPDNLRPLLDKLHIDYNPGAPGSGSYSIKFDPRADTPGQSNDLTSAIQQIALENFIQSILTQHKINHGTGTGSDR